MSANVSLWIVAQRVRRACPATSAVPLCAGSGPNCGQAVANRRASAVAKCIYWARRMKFRLVWPRSNADPELGAVIDRYLNRIKHFFPREVTELAPARGRQGSTGGPILRPQSEQLREAIP